MLQKILFCIAFFFKIDTDVGTVWKGKFQDPDPNTMWFSDWVHNTGYLHTLWVEQRRKMSGFLGKETMSIISVYVLYLFYPFIVWCYGWCVLILLHSLCVFCVCKPRLLTTNKRRCDIWASLKQYIYTVVIFICGERGK